MKKQKLVIRHDGCGGVLDHKFSTEIEDVFRCRKCKKQVRFDADPDPDSVEMTAHNTFMMGL